MPQTRVHQNLFWELEGLETISFPIAILDMLSSGLKPTSLTLYLHILRLAKQDKWRVVRVHTSDILKALQITGKTLKAARDQLKEFKLATSLETRHQGVWEYEVLNPTTGMSLPTRDLVDFTSLSNEVAFEFYMRLMPDSWDPPSQAFWCPFGSHAMPSLQITYDPGTDRHAMWRCQRCNNDSGSKGNAGGMIQLYKRKYRIDRYDEAARRVRSLLQGLIQEEQRAKEEHAVKPITYATIENSNLALV